jgi:hypothetical protein
VHYRTLDVPERFDCHVALLSALLSPAVRRLFAAIATSVPDLISQTDLVALAPSRAALVHEQSRIAATPPSLSAAAIQRAGTLERAAREQRRPHVDA